MEDFSIATRMTTKEYLKIVYIALYRKPRVILMNALALFIVLGGLNDISHFSVTSGIMIFAGLYFLLAPTIHALREVKRFRSIPGAQEEVTYTLIQSGFVIHGTPVKAEIRWSDIWR